MFFPLLNTCINCGADPWSAGRRPRRPVTGVKNTCFLRRGAGPGGPARTRSSAPQFMQYCKSWGNYAELGRSASATLAESVPDGEEDRIVDGVSGAVHSDHGRS